MAQGTQLPQEVINAMNAEANSRVQFQMMLAFIIKTLSESVGVNNPLVVFKDEVLKFDGAYVDVEGTEIDGREAAVFTLKTEDNNEAPIEENVKAEVEASPDVSV